MDKNGCDERRPLTDDLAHTQHLRSLSLMKIIFLLRMTTATDLVAFHQTSFSLQVSMGQEAGHGSAGPCTQVSRAAGRCWLVTSSCRGPAGED